MTAFAIIVAMAQHVKVLAVLHIVLSAIGILIALGLLVVFGGIASFLGLSNAGGMSHDARVAVPILGAVGTLLFVLILALSIPGFIAGFGLLKFRPWARILTIVLSALDLINFPFGTALGVYGFWVLLSVEGAKLFEGS
jgi:hypothetical protein